jgi:hypothetical protein
MLSLMHVGATVHDLPAAMADYAGLVTGPWVVSDPLLFAAYDGIEGGVVDQRVTMAFARLAGGPALELIAPSAETPDSPQRRLLEERPGISHIAYWSSDLATTARELIARGARLFSAATQDGERLAEVLEAQGEDGLLAELRACYLQLASGALVELLDTTLWGAPLEHLCGAGICEVVPAPPV